MLLSPLPLCCEHAYSCVEVFMRTINYHSFIHSFIDSKELQAMYMAKTDKLHSGLLQALKTELCQLWVACRGCRIFVSAVPRRKLRSKHGRNVSSLTCQQFRQDDVSTEVRICYPLLCHRPYALSSSLSSVVIPQL